MFSEFSIVADPVFFARRDKTRQTVLSKRRRSSAAGHSFRNDIIYDLNHKSSPALGTVTVPSGDDVFQRVRIKCTCARCFRFKSILTPSKRIRDYVLNDDDDDALATFQFSLDDVYNTSRLNNSVEIPRLAPSPPAADRIRNIYMSLA